MSKNEDRTKSVKKCEKPVFIIHFDRPAVR